ncbi:MAG: DUF2939 domain-containing protein [Gammaproteobacteria bacterium]
MKFFSRILLPLAVLAAVLFTAYPYVNLYRLDLALTSNDKTALTELVDLGAVRAEVKSRVKKETDRVIGKGDNDITRFFRESASTLTGSAVNAIVDMNWVKTHLRRDGQPGDKQPYPSLFDSLDYAFFDDWNRFLVRLGALNDDPVHLHWAFKDWKWRLVAVYD